MKRVKISFDWWEAEVEIDESEKTLEIMRSQIMFWMDGEKELVRYDGNAEKAYLKMLGQELLPMSREYNLSGILSEFEDLEGWAPLDGSFGVKLISVDSWYFEKNDIRLEQL